MCPAPLRHSKSASKGAQYILYRTTNYETVKQAVADCDVSIAFTRWVKGRSNAYYDLAALTQHPVVQQLITDSVQPGPSPSSSSPDAGEGQASTQQAGASGARMGGSADDASVSTSAPSGDDAGSDRSLNSHQSSGTGAATPRKRVALVFGREELGLSDDEVDACDLVCSIPIGRLQESLSLSHAVTITLSSLFQQRLAHVVATEAKEAATSGEGAADGKLSLASAYVVQSTEGLAAGYNVSEGTEI